MNVWGQPRGFDSHDFQTLPKSWTQDTAGSLVEGEGFYGSLGFKLLTKVLSCKPLLPTAIFGGSMVEKAAAPQSTQPNWGPWL